MKDCLDHTVLPMDGATLAEAMHQRGINMRYLGKVVNFIAKTPGRAQLDHIFVSIRLNCRRSLKTASGTARPEWLPTGPAVCVKNKQLQKQRRREKDLYVVDREFCSQIRNGFHSV